MTSPHAPVLLAEVVEALSPRAGEVMIDATFGAGGYTRAILATGAKVIGLDRDPTVQVHADAVGPGSRVIVLDDVLATGGTARAKIDLVERLGGIVVGALFVIELGFLNGRERLAGYDVHALLEY